MNGEYHWRVMGWKSVDIIIERAVLDLSQKGIFEKLKIYFFNYTLLYK